MRIKIMRIRIIFLIRINLMRINANNENSHYFTNNCLVYFNMVDSYCCFVLITFTLHLFVGEFYGSPPGTPQYWPPAPIS